MLEVAVIGAGTSGLVAARHLIHAGLRPTIFEAARTVGGAWTPSSSSALNAPTKSNDNEHYYSHPAGKMWSGMTTNLSKYTCRFSDWPWPEGSNTFPTVEEMNEYLTSYSDAFLAPSKPMFNFLLECQVTNVEQLNTSSEFNYKVEWMDLQTQTCHSRDFGGVIVATGFFNRPRWPSFLPRNYDPRSHVGRKKYSKPQISHSSTYQSNQLFKDKSVAIVGASFSALEIAADVSKSAARVVSILPSVPWVLPRWVPIIELLRNKDEEGNIASKNNEDATVTILPIDLVLYQRTKAYPQIPETTFLDPESCRTRHKNLQSMVGSKQLHSPLGEPANWDEPPFVAISDEFLDLTREQKIEVVNGRLSGIDDAGNLQIESKQLCRDGSELMSIDDIDHVICCTGFISNLESFLSPQIIDALEYDSEDSFSPLTLAWDTLHPSSLPNMAFCGMYRGPYMGIVELQARIAAGVMNGSVSISCEEVKSALEISRSIRTATPKAQFPHFDYIGYIDTLAKLFYDDCYPIFNVNIGDVVLPSFYQANEEISEKSKQELETEFLRGQDGSRMPNIVLQSILGKWSFERYIMHFQTNKVERVYGTVNYSKYFERSSNDEEEIDGDLVGHIFKHPAKERPVLYREDGVYELSPTQKFDVFREYEYECNKDVLDIFFVEGGKRAHLFLSLKFVPETLSWNGGHNGEYWVKATSDHLCIKDLYNATFRVKLNGLSASEIVIKYRVKGPSKDYESTTILKPSWS